MMNQGNCAELLGARPDEPFCPRDDAPVLALARNGPPPGLRATRVAAGHRVVAWMQLYAASNPGRRHGPRAPTGAAHGATSTPSGLHQRTLERSRRRLAAGRDTRRCGPASRIRHHTAMPSAVHPTHAGIASFRNALCRNRAPVQSFSAGQCLVAMSTAQKPGHRYELP
jgi:hypothetical protein